MIAVAAPPSEGKSVKPRKKKPAALADAPGAPADGPVVLFESSPPGTPWMEDQEAESIFVIRKCQISDLEAVCKMQADWKEEEMDPFFIPSGRGELVVRLSPYFLVAESEGKVLGYVYGMQKTSQGNAAISDGAEYLEIDRIYVAPDARGAQIGGRLLEGLMEKAREEGIGKFMVSANTKNVEQITRFFQAHKFKALSVQFYR
jgi:GNAT superfamily N-acetyltransferase